MANNCSCGCNTGCNTCPQTNPCAPKCKGSITSAELGELLYIAGLDANLCKKYSTIIDALGLNDCAGNPITAGTPIVTCAQFQTELCELLAGLTVGAAVAPGTVLVGADCQRHTMPAFQAPLTFNDTNCITLDSAGNVVTANPVISPTPGNTLSCTPNGLMSNVCVGIQALPDGPAITAGTELVGADCNVHVMPAFQAPITVSDTSCIDLTFAGNNISATPIISPAVGNQLACTAQGLYVQPTVVPPETPLTVVDTPSVNLTASGTANHTLQADVVISPNAGNATVIVPNGLYTPTVCEQFADIGGIATPIQPGDILITQGCLPRTFPVNGGVLVDDTVTVDMTITGNTITSDVNVSSVPDNILEIRPDGLAVRCTAVNACVPNTIITAIDTPCFDLSVTETPENTFTITGSPIVSPTAGNQLSCSANGLFVPASGPATEITCAAVQNLFTDVGTVIQPAQRILVDTCQTFLAPSYVPIDTQTVDTVIGADGSGNPTFSANVKLDPNPVGLPANCNGLSVTANGLVAPPNSTGNRATTFNNSILVNTVMENGDTVSSPTFTVNISNPSPCRNAVLVVEMEVPQIATSSIQPGVFALEVNVYHSFNLPTILVSPMTIRASQQIVDNDTAAVTPRAGNDTSPSSILTQFTVPPGFTGSYSVMATVNVFGGEGTVLVGQPSASYFLYTI